MTLKEMLGSDSSIYPSDKSGALSSGNGGGDRDRGIGGRKRVGYGSTEVGILKRL